MLSYAMANSLCFQVVARPSYVGRATPCAGVPPTASALRGSTRGRQSVLDTQYVPGADKRLDGASGVVWKGRIEKKGYGGARLFSTLVAQLSPHVPTPITEELGCLLEQGRSRNNAPTQEPNLPYGFVCQQQPNYRACSAQHGERQHALWSALRKSYRKNSIQKVRLLVASSIDPCVQRNNDPISYPTQIGIRYDKLPGEWYGPTTAACVLRDIAELYNALPIPPPPPLRQTGTTGTAARCPPQTAPPRQDKMSPVAENGDHGVVRSSNRDKNGDNGLQDRVERSNNDRVAPCACAGGADAGAAVTLAAGVASGDGQDISSVENAAGACASRSRSPSRASGERGRQVQSVRAATSGRRDGGSGTDCEGGCGIVSPESVSLRPLRVFVSQGDVVYIDEVEAMALRKGVDEGAMGISRDGVVGKGGADEGSTAGSTVEAGGSSNTDGGEQGVARSIKGDDTAGRNGLMGEGEGLVDGDQETTSDRGSSPPAFYDPLLNPGVDDSGKKEKEAWSSAVVLLVPLRLGLDELGAGYIPGALLKIQFAFAGWKARNCPQRLSSLFIRSPR